MNSTIPVKPAALDSVLLNSRQIAAHLRVSPFVLKGIKRAGIRCGDSPFTGRFSTLPRILGWLERHPEFVASHHLRKRRH